MCALHVNSLGGHDVNWVCRLRRTDELITPGFWASEGRGYSPLFEPPPVGYRTESLGQNGVGTRSCPSLAVSPGASTGEPSSSNVPSTRRRLDSVNSLSPCGGFVILACLVVPVPQPPA